MVKKATRFPVPSDTTLICLKCEEEKPDEMFWKCSSAIYRRCKSFYCIPCDRKVKKEYKEKLYSGERVPKRVIRKEVKPGYLPCKRCDKEFPRSDFVTGHTLKTKCKNCRALENKEYRLKRYALNGGPTKEELAAANVRSLRYSRKVRRDNKQFYTGLQKALTKSISYLLENKIYTKQQLADLLEINKGTMYYWCRGRKAKNSYLVKYTPIVWKLKKAAENGTILQRAGEGGCSIQRLK